MKLVVGVPKETFPGDRSFALAPGVVPTLRKGGFTTKLLVSKRKLSWKCLLTPTSTGRHRGE